MSDDSMRWLVCGAGAGLTVDIGLYPLDTIKTRLQSKQGFVAAGGFRKLYRHEYKEHLSYGMGSIAIGSAPGAALFFFNYRIVKGLFTEEDSLVHAISASSAETIACAIRVPTELIKQRLQGSKCSPIEGAACGSIAGTFAAAATTPLDVAKTRIMLSKVKPTPTVFCTLKNVYSYGGFPALFSGITPRVLWMAAGGFIFFGAFETMLAFSYWAYPAKY
ncbi:hypothetical protein DICVIV_01295 [Dictyocaulus viviparus]|uniref:Carrier protein PET8 domain protein n=1 Tax=Dictyocaulus viviparus TaxID=29172 RepID=A0A0D8Y6U2_DICVI|nr:hypothetical protein DICVIV_01295 [Dictyocaulus viviparus]